MPITLYAHDTKYGVFTLNYESATGYFVGCKVVAYPGLGSCPALGSIAVRHVLVSRSTFKTYWKSAGGTLGCPVSSSCSDTLNASFQWSAGTSQCEPFQAQFHPDFGSGGPTYLAYGANDGVTVLTT
jgi:hypothetical protein